MKLPASLARHKNLLGIGAAMLSVGLFGAAAVAIYEGQTSEIAPVVVPVATPDPSAATPDQPAQGKDTVKAVTREAMNTAASYLGIAPRDLMTQLGSGKSLGDIANATPGRSRDALMGALSDAANKSLDTAVASGQLTSDQAAMAKKKLPEMIGKLVDRKGAPHK